MELKSRSLLSPILLVILVTSYHYQVSATSPDAWRWHPRRLRPIVHMNAPILLEIARFAVSEHNKKVGGHLSFVRVVDADIRAQSVEATNFKLVIIANDEAAGNTPHNYKAVVWDKPKKHIRELISFVKLF